MARIVLTSFGSYGDVNPYVGLALALRSRGHEPVLALPAAYRGAAEREALAFHPVRPDVDIHDRAFAARIMDPARGTDVTFSELIVPHLAETAADLEAAARGADLLVTHPASLAGPVVAEGLGMPWASTVLSPMSFFSRYDPIVPAPAPWMHAITSRSRPAARIFRWMTERVTQKWADPVRRFRKARGLPPGGNPILDGQHSPRLVLGLFSRVLGDPQADWPRARRRDRGQLLQRTRPPRASAVARRLPRRRPSPTRVHPRHVGRRCRRGVLRREREGGAEPRLPGRASRRAPRGEPALRRRR
ncbi:MAG: hypothetical protein AB7N65_01110 [Vicinamibacterales bacterium]